MVFRRTPELSASLRRAAEPTIDPIESARGVLWIALTIRKLSEAGEIPPVLQRRTWPVGFHPARTDAQPSRDDLDGSYELAFSRQDSLPTLRLCGLLIHCFTFSATAEGVYFTSHVEKRDGLYFLRWDVLGQVVAAVCDAEPRRGVIRAA